MGREPHGEDPKSAPRVGDLAPSVIELGVEVSGINPELGSAEACAVAQGLGGELAERLSREGPALIHFAFRDEPTARSAAERLALARRCLLLWRESGLDELQVRFFEEGKRGQSAAFRRFGSSQGSLDSASIVELGSAYRAGGGSIDLNHPQRRFWLFYEGNRVVGASEEVARPDHGSLRRRAMPHLPFQRPISLPVPLARATVNLAGISPGARVADPFVGTGALLCEAALVGAKVTGVDRDARMVRGANQNLSHLGRTAEELIAGDAEDVARRWTKPRFDAVVTDPPYGRASSTGKEPPDDLLARVLPAWAKLVVPKGRIVLVVPGGPDALSYPWTRTISVPQRVHRSLTREFRVYQREQNP